MAGARVETAMGTRIARLGFATFAATTGMSVSLAAWQRYLLARLHDSPHDVTPQLKILGGAYLGLTLLGVLAVVAMTRLPRSLRARPLLWTSAALALLGLAVSESQRLLWDGGTFSMAQMEMILRITHKIIVVSAGAADILLLVVGLRIARALAAKPLRGLVMAAIGVRVVTALAWFAPFAGDWNVWLMCAADLGIAVACAALAATVTRLPDAPATGGDDDGRRSAEWQAPAQGIALYLGATLARILLSILTWATMRWATMRSANHMQDIHDLRDVRGMVLALAVPSACASIAMLVGLWRISRAPAETQAAAPALRALALGTLGLLLEGWTTSIIGNALDGDVGAAFFAMKALPVVAGVSLLLGVGLALSLLQALSRLAAALERADLVARARTACLLLVAAAGVGGLGALLASLSAELLIGLVVIVVPLVLIAAVEFLLVAVGVAGAIRTRQA
jgi:hypothetical protein